jgi:hypothetical protein
VHHHLPLTCCRFSFFGVVTQRCLIVTDVSVQLIGPIFKGQTVFLDYFTLADATDRLPETSVKNA